MAPIAHHGRVLLCPEGLNQDFTPPATMTSFNTVGQTTAGEHECRCATAMEGKLSERPLPASQTTSGSRNQGNGR
jgi:hypothetical protein